MRADVLEVEDLEVGRARERVRDDGDAGNEAARENEALDEVHRLAGLVVELVLDRDGLQQHGAVVLEQARALGEVGIEVVRAHGLDHLDRHGLVVASGKIPVVLEQQRDAVLEAGARDLLFCVIVLLARDRGGRDVDAVMRGGVQGEPAPAGADLDHALARAQRELAAHGIEFRHRRLFQRRVLALEDAAGVGHGGVEHQRVELVAQVIVRRDVARAALAAVAVQDVEQAQERPAHQRPAAVHAVHEVAVDHEEADQAGQVVAAPQAADIGLARAHRAAEGGVGVELRVVDRQAHAQVEPRRAAPESVLGAIGLGDDQFAILQAGELAEQEAPPQAGERRGIPLVGEILVERDDRRLLGLASCVHVASFLGWVKNGTRLSSSFSACQ